VDACGHLVQTGKSKLSGNHLTLSVWTPEQQLTVAEPRRIIHLGPPSTIRQDGYGPFVPQSAESREREALSHAYVRELEARAQSLLQRARMEQHHKAHTAQGTAQVARHTSKTVNLRKQAHELQVRAVTNQRTGIRIRHRAGARTRTGPPLTKEDLYLTSERPPDVPQHQAKAEHVCGLCKHLKSHPML
jgi:hypothetical protein